jgi:RNA polymerase sigma-70 factor, ECF subfamily
MGMFQVTGVRLAVRDQKPAVSARRRSTEATNSRDMVLPREGSVLSGAVSSERSVFQLAIAGNVAAKEHVFAGHSERLYRTAYSVLRNKEDAEDALQDGLLNAYQHLSSYEGRSSFSTWLTRIVINSALMIRRTKHAHPEASLDEILDSQSEKLPRGAIDPRPNPEETCAAIEMERLIQAQVRELPPTLRTAIRVRQTKRGPAAQSSHALGISTSAFKSRMHRARRKLASRPRRSHGPRSGQLAVGA